MDSTPYSYNVVSLSDLIATAWGVDYFQMSSAASLDKQDFGLAVTAPEGAKPNEFRTMLQNLPKSVSRSYEVAGFSGT